MMYLQIKVIPKSAQTKFVEIMADGTYKFRLKAAPEKGKANAELIKFLAKTCNIHKDDILIISGYTDQRKLVKIPNNTKLPWQKQINP